MSSRRVAFFVLLLAAAMAGAIAATVSHQATAAAFFVGGPAYLCWIVADLRARAVRGVTFWLCLLVSLVPAWGLLAYLLVSRRTVGLLMWLAMSGALCLSAGMSALLARGLFCAVTGARW